MKKSVFALIVLLSIVLSGAALAWDRQAVYDCDEGNSKYICTYSEKRDCYDDKKGQKVCKTLNSTCDLTQRGGLRNDYLGDLGESMACRNACVAAVYEGECANTAKWRRAY